MNVHESREERKYKRNEAQTLSLPRSSPLLSSFHKNAKRWYFEKKNVYSLNSWLWQNVNERVTHSAVCAKNASALHSWKMTIIGLLFFILSRPQRAQITSKKLLECFNDKCDKILSETEHISHSSLFFHPHKDNSTIYS